ncbi:MAG: hypothetical protein P8R48_14390 [Planctomycetota bacterium]|nr:hypothetical protein [Planctomycetota bacterium]
MNRTTVLVLALVVLLAHILAMHHDSTGAFALPSDEAHVNFHIARNLVHAQGTVWSAGATPAAILEEGGTSLVWTLVAAAGEIWESSPIRITSALGILCALLTIVTVARLSRSRLVGVAATVLLVVSGPLAATAADGTEIALYTLLVAAGFLFFERRRSKWVGGCLTLLVLTKSIGIIWVLGFLIAELSLRRKCVGKARLRLEFAFLPPVLAFVAFSLARTSYGATFFAPDLQALATVDGESIALGLSSLLALIRGTVAPALVLLPIVQLLRGKLGGTGRRALGLALLGATYVVLTGGANAPMHAVWVPILPLAYFAVQEALIASLDHRPKLEGLAWAALSISCFGSVLASKIPGDLGPLPTRPLLQAMARNDELSLEAHGAEWSGRLAVSRDIWRAERLRAVGLFFRHSLGIAPDAVILTPWPGAIGYLSERTVVDLLGRTAALPGHEAVTSRRGRVRSDTVAALLTRPDFVVPMIADRAYAPTQVEFIQDWLERYDTIGPTEERKLELLEALGDYELVTVPIPSRQADSNAAAFLLRRSDLGLAPKLTIKTRVARENRFTVSLSHSSHLQIAELEVRVDTVDGSAWYLRPDGVFVREKPVRSRTEALVFPTGDRKVELVYAQLGPHLSHVGIPAKGLRMTARLLNPFSDETDLFSLACEPVETDF